MLIFLVRSVLWRSTKSRGAPKDTDAMVGLSPYLQTHGRQQRQGRPIGGITAFIRALKRANSTSIQQHAANLNEHLGNCSAK